MTSRMKRLGVLLLIAGSAAAQRLADLELPAPLPPNGTVVVGFLGGFESWNDEHRSVRRLALALRQIPGVYADSIANRNRQVGLKSIKRALDTNRDGHLDAKERARARVILFGQSWGGAAAIQTARDLKKLGVPVLLTVQVDSVGRHDRIVPANVRAAVNFYQHDPLTIWGRGRIQAADPTKTRILGNFSATYLGRPMERPEDASWSRRTFGGSHAKMELDSELWEQVRHYITEAIAGR